MVSRRGSALRGCLTLILFASAATYAGLHVGAPYLRFLQYRDAATQEARFAALHPDTAIEHHLWDVADSLGLPEAAYHVQIGHPDGILHIRAQYDDSWQLLRYSRPVHFRFDVATVQ